MRRLLVLLAAIGLLASAAAAAPAGPENSRDPVLNFEYAWKSLDRNYAQFGVKNVDWDALYRVYRPRVTAATTDEELWNIILDMIRNLNDNHVCLADEKRRNCGGVQDAREPDDFSLDLVRSKYLKGGAADTLKGSFTYGWLADGIGYLHFSHFKAGAGPTTQALDAALAKLAGARAMIVDVRGNPGGSGKTEEFVANRFADRKRHYIQTQTRYGRKHDDLWPAEYRYVEPGGTAQFTGPTILLAHRLSASSADIFALAMRVLPHVTMVGDLTEGALSSQFPDKMPNGWTLWIAFKVIRDVNGVCWDGIGVPPDIRIVNTPEDIASGNDRVLEFALDLLEKGAPAPQDEAASLRNLKISLVQQYARDAKEKGVEAAVAGLKQARAKGGDASFFGVDEAMQLAGPYIGNKQYAEAIGLLRACREEFPPLAVTYAMLAQAYLGAGDAAAAEASLEEGEKFEPMFSWELPQIERAKTAVRKEKVGSAAAVVGKELESSGIPAAEKALKELLAQRDKGGPVFDEADFNALGYKLMQENKLEAAVYMFEKGTELYPDSWNAYDSLGECLAAAGQKERAIASYRKSLELNPGNANGRAALQRLEDDK
jgi:tetratricopeptide (TPR) repeat protein